MKQLHLFLLTMLSFTFLLTTACGDDDAPGVDAGSGKVTATVDGKSWASKSEKSGAVYGASMGNHQIQAFAADGSFIGLTVFGSITAGATIDAAGGIFQAQYKPDAAGTEIFAAVGGLGSGTITFSQFSDKKVKGTFQFTGAKANMDGTFTNLEVKNGSFDFDL